jgi:hypothetical protein
LGTLASDVTSNLQLDQDTSSNVVPPKKECHNSLYPKPRLKECHNSLYPKQKSNVYQERHRATANHAAIADTGATGHHLDAAAEPHCINVTPTNEGPSVRVTNGQNIETSKRATVPLAKELSNKAKVGHMFDDLKSGSLLSIGQLCDDDCVALFSKYDVKTHKEG